LAVYADRYQADASRWLFVTGSRETIDALAIAHFKTSRVENWSSKPGFEIAHSNRVFVLDRTGRLATSGVVVKEHEGGEVFEIDEARVSQLGQEILLTARPWVGVLPTLNACLNGLSAVLLSMGFLLIRQRNERAHVACMLGAFGVSAVFLASYLLYHYFHGHTVYSGHGPIRWVYYTILLTHVVLAVAVVPMIFATLYYAFRDRRPQHRAVARWTLPIWLYVSVTGVVVYLMLYVFKPV
jgi:uncharacterized membrane protein YozB (DUF420 family)